MAKNIYFFLLLFFVTVAPLLVGSEVSTMPLPQLFDENPQSEFVVAESTFFSFACVAHKASVVRGGFATACFATGNGLKTAARKMLLGARISWRWFWGEAPRVKFLSFARCTEVADLSMYVQREEPALWKNILKEHGVVKGNALRFVARQALRQALVGAATGAFAGAIATRSCQDAAGISIFSGGVSAVLSALCLCHRARFDQIADHRDYLIRRASAATIPYEFVAGVKTEINKTAGRLDCLDVNHIADRVFQLRYGRFLLETTIE